MDPSTNYIHLTFVIFFILIFTFGLLVCVAERHLPFFVMEFIHYGKGLRIQDRRRGSVLKLIEVPKNWYIHCSMFAVILQALVLITVVTKYTNFVDISFWLRNFLTTLGGNSRPNSVDAMTTVISGMLCLLQVSRRSYETHFLCVYSGTTMSGIYYISTWLHYVGVVLTTVAYSPDFSNGINNFDPTLSFNSITLLHVIASMLYFYGAWIQNRAHVRFAKLRRSEDKQEGFQSIKHQIPRGWLFELISCPNYWGEIIIYFAITLLFAFRNHTWNYVAAWVIANQIVLGVVNHRWYLNTFPAYPKDRKAVIPFIL